MSSKPAFVLSGGGAKGAFQVGVLEMLDMKGIVPAALYGTSVGAVNAAGFSYKGVDGLKDIWLDIRGRKDVLSLQWWKIPFLYWSTGLYSMKPLRRILEHRVTGQARYPITVSQTNLETAEVEFVKNDEVSLEGFKDAIMASSSLPFLMEAHDIIYRDGGVRDQVPLSRAIMDGHETIYVILSDRFGPLKRWEPKTNIIDNNLRSFEIITHEAFMNDLHFCINEHPKIKFKLFSPERDVLGHMDYDPAKIREAIEHGKEVAT